jgi:hypothetical protein
MFVKPQPKPWRKSRKKRSRYSNDWKRTTDTPQTGDQVRSPAEEDGKEPDCGEDQQEEKVKSSQEYEGYRRDTHACPQVRQTG